MPYPIYLSNGTQLTTIADGAIDSNSTSLVLLGRNFAGYGGYHAGNFVHHLENFASTTPPNNPLVGQLWFDTTNQSPAAPTLKVYLNGNWIVAGVAANNTFNSTTINPLTITNLLDITNPNAPTNARRWRIQLLDDGSLVLEVMNDNGTVKFTPISMHADGTLWAAFNPATDSNSLRLATTAWVKALGYVVGGNNGGLNQQQIITALGYTPVQQGGGAGQTGNKLYLGWEAGGRLRLQVDSTDQQELAFLRDVNWTQITGKPAFSDAATTSVATIRSGVDVSSRVAKAGDTMTGSLTMTAGQIVYTDHVRFAQDTDTGLSWAAVSDTSCLIHGGEETHIFYRSGELWTKKYGYLGDTFTTQSWVTSQNYATQTWVAQTITNSLAPYANWTDTVAYLQANYVSNQGLANYNAAVASAYAAQIPQPGQGSPRYYGGGNAGVADNAATPDGWEPVAQGYEVYHYGSGRHQVRAWVQNCQPFSGGGSSNCTSNISDGGF